MFWIFAGIALGLVLLPARFRRLGAAGVVAVILVFVAVIAVNRRSPPDVPSPSIERTVPPAGSRRFDFDQYERDKKDRADPGAKTRIPISALRFDQVQPITGIDAGSIRAVRARLYNDSHEFPLTDYSFYLVIQDCLPTGEGKPDRCTTVYDQRGTASLIVPPDQARDVTISIPRNPPNSSAPFKLLGTARVELTPVEARAYQPTPGS